MKRWSIVLLVLIAGFLVVWQRGRHRAPAREEERVQAPRTSGGTFAAPAEAGGTVEGVVLDPAGAPVRGARVILTAGRKLGEAGPLTPYKPIAAATSSGGDGRFRLTDVAPAEYGAAASADGFLPAFQSAVAVTAAHVTRLELRLAPGGLLLSGHILDASGGPVPGAKIVVGRQGGESFGRPPPLVQPLADDGGAYRVTLGRGSYWVNVSAPGYTSQNDTVVLDHARVKDFLLAPGARISGRVVERDGRRPVADAEVSAVPADRRGGFRPGPEGHSDASGAFSLAELEAGTYQLSAHKGRLLGTSKASISVGLAQSVADQEIVVGPAAAIVGHVREKGKGTPIGGMRVWAYVSNGMSAVVPTATKTDAGGAYALEGLPAGTYRLEASGPGHGRTVKEVQVGTGEVTQDLELEPGPLVSGRVLDRAGKPVLGAMVSATSEPPGRGGGRSLAQSTTKDDGTFELVDLAAGTLIVNAQKGDEGVASAGPTSVGAGERKELTLTLGKGAFVSGKVRQSDGTPAPGVQVAVMMTQGRAASMPSALSEASGDFRVGPLPRGELTVSASRRGLASFSSGRDVPNQKSLTLGDAEERTGVELVVPLGGQHLAGVVVGPDGKPVELVTVIAGLESNGFASRDFNADRTISSGDGKFRFDDLSDGTYTVWAVHPDHADAELKSIKAGTTDLRIALARDASVSGVAVDQSGKPITDFSITALPGAVAGENADAARRRRMGAWNKGATAVRDPSGAFTVRKLAAGSHELMVTTAEGRTGSQTVTVSAGERKSDARVVVESGLRVSGRVLDLENNSPVEGVTVAAQGPAAARVSTTTRGDGTFVIESAPSDAGQVRLSVAGDLSAGFIPESRTLTVSADRAALDAGTIHLMHGDFRARAGAQDRGYAGVLADLDDQGNTVIRGVQNAGARAGLSKGDRLLAIDGRPVTNLGPGALSYLIGGKVGEKVDLTVVTPGSPPRTVSIVREASGGGK